MRRIPELSRIAPRDDSKKFIELEVRPIGRRTLDWMSDPEGEARKIWNSVRKTQSIPADALTSQSAFEGFVEKKSRGLLYLIKHEDFYTRVLTLEGEQFVERADEIKEQKKFVRFRGTLIGKKIDDIKRELPVGLSAEKIKVKGKSRVYIRDEKTGRFKTHFVYTWS